MKLTFLGAVHEVTGSCTLLEANGRNILIDCGMEQGEDIYENCELPVLPGDIDAILLTHAHIDHSGMIPAMSAAGYNSPVYCTEATRRLCSIMLRDSAHIQEFEAEWRNRKAKRSGDPEYVPVYTVEDAERAMRLFEGHSYEETFTPFEGINVRFTDAGHLLGSASIFIDIEENGEKRTVVFSGDIGNVNRPLIRDPKLPGKADYVIIESTYGDRLHAKRPDYVAQLTEILQETFERGGNVVIPSFAIGRTQEMLYLLRIIKERGLVKNHSNFPVYVDSPLAVEATNIYSDGMTEYYDAETLELLSHGTDPINFSSLRLSVTSDESKLINFDDAPKVILSASGMCEAGRIRHHLKHNLWREDSTVLFVGYQAEGTIGRKIIEGADTVKLFGEEIAINARIATLDGISGHADRDMLLGWLGNLSEPPKTVFINHGNDAVCDTFAGTVREKLGFEAIAPYSGDCYDLVSGACVERGRIVRVQKEAKVRRNQDIYNRLVSAGKRAAALIKQFKGRSNKEISRFAEQLNALCEKYK